MQARLRGLAGRVMGLFLLVKIDFKAYQRLSDATTILLKASRTYLHRGLVEVKFYPYLGS